MSAVRARLLVASLAEEQVAEALRLLAQRQHLRAQHGVLLLQQTRANRDFVLKMPQATNWVSARLAKSC